MLAQVRHDALHLGKGVREVLLESAAEIVQARLARRRADDPVFRATSGVAGGQLVQRWKMFMELALLFKGTLV